MLTAFCLLLLVGCGDQAPVTLMPTAAPPDGQVVENPLSSLPTLTASPVPSVTPSPTATSTPSPTPTPTPQPSDLLAEARLARSNGDYRAAAAALRELGAAPGVDEDVLGVGLLELGEVLLRDGAAADAQVVLEAFLEQHPGTPQGPQATFWLAQARQIQSDWQGALAAYQNYLSLDDMLVTYVSDLMADVHLELGDVEAAVTAYETALSGAGTAATIISIRERLAEAYQAAGDLDSAIAQYDAISALTDDVGTLARMDYLAGYALAISGRPDEGYQRYLHAVDHYPAAFDSYLALIELVDAGYAVDDFQRGLVDYHAGATIPAISAFYRVIEADPDNHPADPHLYLARCYASLENYAAAHAELDVLIETHSGALLWGEAWLERAWLQRRQGRFPAAVDTYLSFVARDPANGLAPIALWRAAAIWESEGDWDAARELYRQLAADYPTHQDAPEALLRAGLMAHQAGNDHDAVSDWDALVVAYPDSDWAAPALVWLQNSLPAEEAAAYHPQIKALAPDNYYAIRAADLMSDIVPFEPAVAIRWPEADEGRTEAENWLRGWLGLDQEADLGLVAAIGEDPRWERGQRLWQLGLVEEARTELNNLRYDLSSNALASYQLALAFRDMGLYRSSILAAAAVIRLSPAATPFDVPPFVARLSYPAYYHELIDKVALEYDLDPLLLLSMIRQESLFESFARSWAAAQGLMQVIPSTGEYIARQLNWPEFEVEDLNKPYVSVRFGAYYLAEQLDAFDDDVFVALSAYNAGPGNAAYWVAQAPDDPDLYLETITLSEPRSYIQRIYAHYTFYRALYDQ